MQIEKLPVLIPGLLLILFCNLLYHFAQSSLRQYFSFISDFNQNKFGLGMRVFLVMFFGNLSDCRQCSFHSVRHVGNNKSQLTFMQPEKVYKTSHL